MRVMLSLDEAALLGGLLVTIAGVVGAFVSNLISGRGTAQRDTIGALSVANATYKDQIANLEKQVQVLETKVGQMQEHEKFLRDLVTGVPNWAKLMELMADNNSMLKATLAHLGIVDA